MSSQENPNKTIIKNTSQKYLKESLSHAHQIQTAQERKCKSMCIPNRINLKNGHKLVSFPVFDDGKIGMKGNCANFIIDLQADEDCESTSSIVRYGVNLCHQDLNGWMARTEGRNQGEEGSEDYEF